MTTYNTQNPIGSTDPRDLYDNAENLDELVNSQNKTEHNDRMGVQRKTWYGMEEEFDGDQARRENEHDAAQTYRANAFQASQDDREVEFNAAQDDREGVFNAYLVSAGYQFAGDYAAGIEITEYNQIVRDSSGEFWRLSGATPLPYTTDGSGLPEGGNFVAIGDAALRQELALPVSGGNGALHVSGAVIYVDSIADRDALPSGALVDGQVVHVRGAGEFSWDAAEQVWCYTDATKAEKMVGYHAKPIIRGLSSVGANYVIGSVGDDLYASSSSTIYVSRDVGQSWSVAHDFSVYGSLGGNASLWSTNDGEVIVCTGARLFKSAGWSADPQSATFTQVLGVADMAKDSFIRGWGISVVDNYVYVSEYGQPKPTGFFGYVSTDNGASFTQAFDLRDVVANSTNNAHNHGCCIDPYNNYRLWQITADSGNRGIHWSDDLGATWSTIPEVNLPVDGGSTPRQVQPTSIIATENGLVLASDSRPNGIWFIPRDDRYDSDPHLEVLYTLRTGTNSLTHIGSKQIVVGNVVYTEFAVSTGIPSFVTATDHTTGEVWRVWDGWPVGSKVPQVEPNPLGTHNIFYVQDSLVVLTGGGELQVCPVYAASVPRDNSREMYDTGNVIGGYANPSQDSVAVGMLSSAGGLEAAALGSGTDASGSRSVALGAGSIATASEAVAIGDRAKSSGLRAVAHGMLASASDNDSLAIGYQASSTAAACVAIGQGALGRAAGGVAIGQNADSSSGAFGVAIGADTNSSNRGVAIGNLANGGGKIQPVVIGYNASTNQNYGIAIGASAKALHTNSIALGREVETTEFGQIKLPGSHVELGNTTYPSTPPAGNARLFVWSNGGVQTLSIHFANGSVKEIATDV